MVQRRRSPRFLRETLQTIGISGKRSWQNFDCDIAVQPRVSRPINLAHAAGANWRMNLVRPQLRSRSQWHLCARLYPRPLFRISHSSSPNLSQKGAPPLSRVLPGTGWGI